MPASAEPSSSRLDRRVAGLRLRAWLLILAAFAIGLLLFVAIWLKQRDTNDFFHAESLPSRENGEAFEPLPVPDTSVTGDNLPAAAAPATPGAGDTAPAPRPATATPASPPAQTQMPPATASNPSAEGVPFSDADTEPVPISQPSPRYPQDALRRGESGEAMLRLHVDADGNVVQVDLVRGSGSRLLDRAATDTVRRWRFRPAQRDGRAVEGAVVVPITFNAGR